MFKRLLVIPAIACLLIPLAMPAFSASEGDVVVGNAVVLRVRFASGGFTIKQRADLVTERLNNLLGSDDFDPSTITVAVRNKEYAVVMGDKIIITADKDTAAFNKTTPELLAKTWAENIRKIIPVSKSEIK